MNGYKLSDEEDPQLLNSLTPGTSDQAAPPVMQPPPPTMAPPAAAMPPKPAVAPTALPPVASPKLPGMPAGVTPQQISSYLNTQKGGIDKYGADAQMSLQAALNKRHGSFGNNLTDGLKGFADALMMGVARAGNPGFQQQYDQQEQQYAQDQMGALRGANEANLKGTEAKMSLDKMDPNSPLSKTAQDSYAPLFQKLGYPPGKIKTMSAANIDSALNLMTQYGGKEVEAMLKQYDLEIERMRLGANISNQQQERQLAKEKNQQESLKELAGMPWYSRILHPQISGQLEQDSGLNAPEQTEHPQAGEAAAWANSHPGDPRAAQILQRLKK